MEFNPSEHPHVRYNPLRGEWILVSPNRALRPWDGLIDITASKVVPKYDPYNPLCPRNTRSSGIVNPDYKSTFVFPNDFPALLENTPLPPESDDPLFQAKGARGVCKVLCYHPHSDVHFTSMSVEEVENVIDEWKKQLKEIGEKYLWVQIMENRGDMMGCSNPHPHCQIWASNYFPNEPRIKDQHLRQYYEKYNRPLLQDYLERELQKGDRIIHENSSWVVLIPYWAFWPFETMILPKKQIQRFTDVDDNQRRDLAETLQALIGKYDNLFGCSFPYSMGWHGAPTGEKFTTSMPYWTFHAIYYPPLLRSATVKKFKAAYELVAQDQRDISPEKAAEILREQSTIKLS